MPNSKVCICVPTYNTEKTLARTLDSLARQTYADFEVLIVDNCSTDNTRDVAQQFVDRDTRFALVIADEHGSAEDNFNRCIQLARGKYSAIFHSDDIYHPEMIAAQVEVFESDPAIGVVFTQANEIDENDNLIGKRFCPTVVHKKHAGKLNFSEALSLVLGYGNIFICPSAMMRTTILKDTITTWRGKEFKSSADLDTWLRAMQVADGYIIDRALINYRVSSVSFSYHYNFLRTETADYVKVIQAYVDTYRQSLSDRDLINFRLELFKDIVNQAISHLILGEREQARRKLLSELSAKVVRHSMINSRRLKFLLFAIVSLLLTILPLGGRSINILRKIRFGR
ncbi:MAG: glycosyltransferase [Motiliproteus sp.]|nr:glycosyltransferase [Motiliproteus sp.]MCW9053462.1 glycosyltransferase [Motiliproteus sp.]